MCDNRFVPLDLLVLQLGIVLDGESQPSCLGDPQQCFSELFTRHLLIFVSSSQILRVRDAEFHVAPRTPDST